MNLQLLRFGKGMELGNGKVAVWEIESRRLFARIVRSLLSEQGKDATEPYQLWGDNGKAVNPKKALIVMNSLPTVPYDNKTLLGKLYSKVAQCIESDIELENAIQDMGANISRLIDDAGMSLWGNYSFAQGWALEQYLKAFEYRPNCGTHDATLLEDCIRFFELCLDVGCASPIVMVNAKSFFDTEDLEGLYSQAVFLGTSLLVLETQHDSSHFEQERKMVIDQDFLVSP